MRLKEWKTCSNPFILGFRFHIWFLSSDEDKVCICTIQWWRGFKQQ